jgi:hypothetical protein
LAALAALAANLAWAAPRNVAGFDSVHAQDAVRVDIVSGDQPSVDVSGPEAGRVRTEVQGTTLMISEINRPWFGHDRAVAAEIRVTMPRVAAIASAKGATIIAKNVQGGDVSLAASMGGELKASGACQWANVAASMGGVVRADGLQCARATVSASMGGEARVFASANYDASASMGGEVRVAGGGARGRVSTSFGGEVASE